MPVEVPIIPLDPAYEWDAQEPRTPGESRIDFLGRVDCSPVLVFACPGCGRMGAIVLGLGHKPAQKPSWAFSGDTDDPATWTTTPSIHCVGCCGWHGYLTNGVYRSC